MSRCPNCGDEGFDDLDSDFHYCRSCDEFYEPNDDDGDGDADGHEAWCDNCGDVRPVDDDGCCARCGEEVGS